MDTIISALKDLGGKKWVKNFLLPSTFFISILTFHLAIIKIGFTNLSFWWAGLSFDIKISSGIVFLMTCFLVATLFDFGTDSILRLFSGFDSGFEDQAFGFRWFHKIGRSYYIKYFQQQNQKYQTLATKEVVSYIEQQEIARLEDDLHNFPVQQTKIRSTKIGNVLSSAVEYTELRYGLDLRATWARMVYSICPETFRDALIESRTHLDLFLRLNILTFIYVLFVVIYYFSTRIFFWGLLFLVIGYFVLQAISTWCQSSAKDYAELIKSMYDLYRFDLYTSLRISLPKKSGDAEIIAGKQLSEYLWRGTNEIKYADIKKTE